MTSERDAGIVGACWHSAERRKLQMRSMSTSPKKQQQLSHSMRKSRKRVCIQPNVKQFLSSPGVNNVSRHVGLRQQTLFDVFKKTSPSSSTEQYTEVNQASSKAHPGKDSYIGKSVDGMEPFSGRDQVDPVVMASWSKKATEDRTSVHTSISPSHISQEKSSPKTAFVSEPLTFRSKTGIHASKFGLGAAAPERNSIKEPPCNDPHRTVEDHDTGHQESRTVDDTEHQESRTVDDTEHQVWHRPVDGTEHQESRTVDNTEHQESRTVDDTEHQESRTVDDTEHQVWHRPVDSTEHQDSRTVDDTEYQESTRPLDDKKDQESRRPVDDREHQESRRPVDDREHQEWYSTVDDAEHQESRSTVDFLDNESLLPESEFDALFESGSQTQSDGSKVVSEQSQAKVTARESARCLVPSGAKCNIVEEKSVAPSSVSGNVSDFRSERTTPPSFDVLSREQDVESLDADTEGSPCDASDSRRTCSWKRKCDEGLFGTPEGSSTESAMSEVSWACPRRLYGSVDTTPAQAKWRPPSHNSMETVNFLDKESLLSQSQFDELFDCGSEQSDPVGQLSVG